MHKRDQFVFTMFILSVVVWNSRLGHYHFKGIDECLDDEKCKREREPLWSLR